MRSFTSTTLSTLALALYASAFQVTQPSQNSGWSSTGTNTLAWSRVNTDPTNFTVALTNLDRTILPENNQILVNFVDATTQNSLAIAAPSGGFPVGGGFRVNLIKDANDVSTIYAQSDNFNITSGTASGSATGSTVTAGASGTTAVVSGTTATLTSGTVSVSAGSNTASGSSTDTSLNPSATNSNAAAPRSVHFGLLGAMLFLGAVLA